MCLFRKIIRKVFVPRGVELVRVSVLLSENVPTKFVAYYNHYRRWQIFDLSEQRSKKQLIIVRQTYSVNKK